MLNELSEYVGRDARAPRFFLKRFEFVLSLRKRGSSFLQLLLRFVAVFLKLKDIKVIAAFFSAVHHYSLTDIADSIVVQLNLPVCRLDITSSPGQTIAEILLVRFAVI